ncbi:MAG TPA: TonB-dependent receptor [Polyangiaceae bacterium]|nr:TonB-dependent receptor [Polyangiaceae bacterium]
MCPASARRLTSGGRLRVRVRLLGTLLPLLVQITALAQTTAGARDHDEPTPSDLSLVELLDTEVVSASLSEQSLAEAAAVIDVITQEDLRARGYRSVAEALQSVAGVDLVSDHFQWNMGVRGVADGTRGYSRIVKVMIDGQPVSFRPSGENFLGLELIPLGVIDHIEIIRGPASVLYGANAFLGVVNIITLKGYGLSGNSLSFGYEGGPKVQSPWGEGVVAQQWGDLSLLLGAAEETTTLDGYRLVPLPGRSHPRAGETSRTQATPNGSAFGRLTYDSETLGTLSLDGHLQRLDRSAEFADWGVMTHDNRLELLNGYGRLRYNAQLGRAVVLDVSGALSHGTKGPSDHLNTAPERSSYIARELGYTGRDLSGTVTYRLDRKSAALLGVDANFEQQMLLTHYAVTPSGARLLLPPAGTPTGERDFRNIGVFAHASFFPFARRSAGALSGLGLAAGAREDTHNIYGNNWSARAGLVYELFERHYVKLLFGTAFRAPSSTQLFSNLIVPTGYIGNPSLKAERARTFELAVGSSPLRGLTLRADAFLTVIDDRVEIRTPPPAAAQPNAWPTNSTPITSKGFEAQIDYRSARFDGYASYSLQSSAYPKQDLLSLSLSRDQVETDAYPRHLLKFGVTWTERAWFVRANAEGRYVGARLGNLDNNALLNPLDYLRDRYALPAYALLDLSISTVGVEPWKGHETVLLAKVRNLFDARYTFPGTNTFDIPGFERSFSLSLRQEL